jgi:ABC-type multidrug transport system ATPase subunit
MSDPTPTDLVLVGRGVHKSYGAQPVLRGVDLSVQRGEIAVLLGENGAGKTTLLRVLAGELLADQGLVLVAGQNLSEALDAARKGLVYVSQRPPLAPLLSLREHAMALARFRNQNQEATLAVLEEVAAVLRLSQAVDKPIRALSGGMTHKAALCLAFCADVPLRILDEPHTGLDVRSALALRGLIRDRQAKGATFVLASHMSEATLALADSAHLLAGGQMVRRFASPELAGFGGDARAFEQAVLAAMPD